MRLATPTLFWALTLSLASPALAQTEEAKAQAQKRYEEGLAFHNRDQEEEAYTRFVQAFAVIQSPPILFNLARSEQLTGRLVDAATHFKEYLARPDGPRITAELRGKARAFLAEIQQKLGHIAIDAPTGTIISLDGAASGTGTLDVQPGTHTVAGQLGPVSRTVTVSCAAGQTVTARLSFDSTPAPVVLPTPTEVSPPPVVTVPDQPQPAQENHTARDVLRWSAAGVAVVGLGLGIGFKADQYSQGSSFNSYVAAHPGACAAPSSAACLQADSLNNSYNTSSTISTVGFVVGGVAAVGTAALWLFWPKTSRESTSALWVVPYLDPAGRGLGMSGRF
jgi:hypothetical protein